MKVSDFIKNFVDFAPSIVMTEDCMAGRNFDRFGFVPQIAVVTGPAGCGKTHTVGETVKSYGLSMCQLDGCRYREISDAMGAPAGFAGHGQGHTIATDIKGADVILIDEFEHMTEQVKAYVIRSLVMGCFEDSAKNKTSLEGKTIILTGYDTAAFDDAVRQHTPAGGGLKYIKANFSSDAKNMRDPNRPRPRRKSFNDVAVLPPNLEVSTKQITTHMRNRPKGGLSFCNN